MPWRILVVDDDPLVRGAICAHLRRRGVRATPADAAGPALARLEAEPFDLLLTDVLLPGRSGLWLLAEVRRRWGGRLPVILVTGWFPDRAQLDLYRAADAVVPKPVRADELMARITRLLAGRGGGDPTGPGGRAAGG